MDTLVVAQRHVRIVLSVAGLVTNLLILLVLLGSKKLRSQVHLTSLLLLAVVDWGRSGSALLKNDLSQTLIGWLEPNTVAAFSLVIGFTQLKMHAAVGLERLFAVVCPIRFHNLTPLHRRITFVWFGLLCACCTGEAWLVFRMLDNVTPSNITAAKEDLRQHWPPATRDACRPTIFNSSPLVIQYLSMHTAVCVAVMILAYIGIKYKLTKKKKVVAALAVGKPPGKVERERRLNTVGNGKAIALVLSTTIALQLVPKAAVPILNALPRGKHFGKLRCSVIMLIGMASLLNTALNIAIYSLRIEGFRVALLSYVTRRPKPEPKTHKPGQAGPNRF